MATTTISGPPTEKQMWQLLQTGGLNLPPASFRLISQGVAVRDFTHSTSTQLRLQADGVLEARWQGRSERFVFEYKTQSTPKTIDAAAYQAIRYGQALGLPPLIVVPFLSEERLKHLDSLKVSAIDLSGNGVLLGKQFSIWRSGAPNRFKETQSIKNVYRGTSSLYARCFLLRQEYVSLTALREFALSRFDLGRLPSLTAPRLVKSTASKVVQSLEEEQIVSRRSDGELRLVDSSRLLEHLRKNYTRPAGPSLEGKTSLAPGQAWTRLALASSTRAVTTGLGSAGRYGVLSGPDELNLYVSDLDAVATLLEIRETRLFPNVRLLENKGDVVYFDARAEHAALWASPVQCWLELATGGPREQDASQDLATRLAQGEMDKLR